MSGDAFQEQLREPIAADAPCGKNLEDTPALLQFAQFNLFGQQTEIGTRRIGQGEDEPAIPPDFGAVRELAAKALDATNAEATKDLRVLAFLAAGELWTNGVLPFCATLEVAAHWLETWFEEVYPRAEGDDLFFRTNALNYFVDRLAIIEPLRRQALVTSRQTGPISLRHLDLATGVATPTEKDGAYPTAGDIDGAFDSTPAADLETLASAAERALAALAAIDARMQAAGGVEAIPNFDGLSDKERQISLRRQLQKIRDATRGALARRASVDGSDVGSSVGDGSGAGFSGSIRSREEALRALDAVARYFQQAEPSSPVPIFVERAKRLVSKSFLDIVQEVIPDALGAVKVAGGIRDSDS
jgi:type VI secretion system protein ImpA